MRVRMMDEEPKRFHNRIAEVMMQVFYHDVFFVLVRKPESIMRGSGAGFFEEADTKIIYQSPDYSREEHENFDYWWLRQGYFDFLTEDDEVLPFRRTVHINQGPRKGHALPCLMEIQLRGKVRLLVPKSPFASAGSGASDITANSLGIRYLHPDFNRADFVDHRYWWIKKENCSFLTDTNQGSAHLLQATFEED